MTAKVTPTMIATKLTEEQLPEQRAEAKVTPVTVKSHVVEGDVQVISNSRKPYCE
jgi:hypothetical protein